ncbi:MAG: hypothetical protein KDD35_12135, partial [Bdellovibrionales bacterium]|nr:hypothetical protein [Bdellovibrionales bacterium]
RRIPYDWSLEGRQNEEGWSINHLMKTYYEVHPTFPGIYSFIEEEGEKVEYPFGSKPGDSFKEDGFSH